jgi:phosphoenolpyruvate carboxykinase (GTP)
LSPFFLQNSRVLKWILERCEGKHPEAVETPIGYVPTPDSLDLSGMQMDMEDLKEVLSVDSQGYLDEVAQIRDYHSKMGPRLPKGVVAQVDALEARLKASLKA